MAIPTFFSGFSFVKNVGKLRKTAIDYFKSEGIKCEVKDGELLFWFKDNVYTLQLCEGDDYAECGIVYECSADEYAALSTEEKTFIADKVNTDLYNHATVYAYNDSFKIDSTFYFTSKNMWNELFIKHFNELNESVRMVWEIICDKTTGKAEEETEKPKKIGFCVPEQNESVNGNNVAAVVKK